MVHDQARLNTSRLSKPGCDCLHLGLSLFECSGGDMFS